MRAADILRKQSDQTGGLDSSRSISRTVGRELKRVVAPSQAATDARAYDETRDEVIAKIDRAAWDERVPGTRPDSRSKATAVQLCASRCDVLAS